MGIKDLIHKYRKPVDLTREKEGNFDRQKYVEGQEVNYEIKVAVFNMTPEEVNQYEGGKYTTQDVVIYAPEEVRAKDKDTGDYSDITLKEDDVITWEGNDYKIDSDDPNLAHSDFCRYIATKVVDGK